MSRKRCHRKPRLLLPPPGMRPKLAPDQVRDLGLAHYTNLDAICRGDANEETLWQWIGGALTWSFVAEMLQHDEALEAMLTQTAVCQAVVERYGRTGRIGFSGPEYQQAKAACEWMDALAAHVDRHIAVQAADRSDAMVNRWRQGHVPAGLHLQPPVSA